MNLTKNQRGILDHTMNRAANRLYLCDAPDVRDMTELVSLGLMKKVGKACCCPDQYFEITKAGKQALEVKQ